MQSFTPKEAEKGKVRYTGINLGEKQLYFTATIGRDYIDLNLAPYARVGFDKKKKSISVTLTPNPKDAFPIKNGVSYSYYLNCPLFAQGMPKGRYAFESVAKEKLKALPITDETILVFTFTKS